MPTLAVGMFDFRENTAWPHKCGHAAIDFFPQQKLFIDCSVNRDLTVGLHAL
jgi:hypothetical protein